MNILYIILKHMGGDSVDINCFVKKSFSGAFGEHFAKIAHKVAKSKNFVDI